MTAQVNTTQNRLKASIDIPYDKLKRKTKDNPNVWVYDNGMVAATMELSVSKDGYLVDIVLSLDSYTHILMSAQYNRRRILQYQTVYLDQFDNDQFITKEIPVAAAPCFLNGIAKVWDYFIQQVELIVDLYNLPHNFNKEGVVL